MKIRKDYYIVPYRHLDIAPEISLTESTILFFFSSLWSEKYNALSNWVSLRSFPLDIERGLWPMIQILTLLLLSHKSLQLIFCVCVCLISLYSFDYILSSVVCLQVHFSFLCHHLSVVDCIQWICCFCYCISGSEISILFLIFLFLCWNFPLGSLF